MFYSDSKKFLRLSQKVFWLSSAAICVFQSSKKKMPDRAGKGLDAGSRRTKKRAIEIAKQQLKHRYWLLYFEDNSSQVIWSCHGSIKMDMLLRTKVTVSME